MFIMFAYVFLVSMTDNTLCFSRFYFAVGFVTTLAFQRTHWACFLDVFVACKALLFVRHGCDLTIYMATKTGETFHAHTVYSLFFVTFEAIFFIMDKVMLVSSMAFITLDSFHEHMTRMAIRFS